MFSAYKSSKFVKRLHRDSLIDYPLRYDIHARLQANQNSRQVTWHWADDDMKAVQSLEQDYACWVACAKLGSREAIQIEICVNTDGVSIFT